MPAEAEVHELFVPVFHGAGLYDAVPVKRIAHAESESKREHRAALGIVGEQEGDAGAALLFNFKFRAYTEAVYGQRILLPSVDIFALGETAHVGKKVRIPAFPERRISLPEIFPAVHYYAVQHSAGRVERDGELLIFYCNKRH